MKMSQCVKGTRVEREISVPLLSRDSGEVLEAQCLLRPLNVFEESAALQGARAYAVASGVPDPKVGDPLYDIGLMLHTLLLGCLDKDSPADKREPFFDMGLKQIEENLGREQIAFLFERQETLQDESSPSIRRVNEAQLFAITQQIADSENDLPFVQLAPGLRLIWARSTARLLMALPAAKSLFGLYSAVTTNAPGESETTTPETGETTQGPN